MKKFGYFVYVNGCFVEYTTRVKAERLRKSLLREYKKERFNLRHEVVLKK